MKALNELASRDGVLAVTPDSEAHLALSWPVDSLKPEVTETFLRQANEGQYLLVGRSMLAIAGIDVQQAEGQSSLYKDRVYVPVDVTPHTDLATKMVDKVRDIAEDVRTNRLADRRVRWNGQQLGFGNIMHIGSLERLTDEQVKQAIDDKFIWIDDASKDRLTKYRVADGSLFVDLAPWELDLDDKQIMADDTQMLDLVLHGRRSFGQHTDVDRREPGDPFGKFVVGNTLIAPGMFTCQVVGTTDPNLRQVTGGAWIHAYRLMGTDPSLPERSRGQQVELINSGAEQTWGEAQVELAFYQPRREERIRREVQPIVDLEGLKPAERARLQQRGYDVMELLKRRDIFNLLSDATRGETGALVVTPNGITKVPRTEYDSRTARHIRDAAISSGRVREIPEDLNDLEPFVEKLGLVANNPRIVFADRLMLSDIPEIVSKGDVQAVVMRDFGSPYMSQQDHIAITELAKKGVTIAWDNNGDVRKMHRGGFWMTPEETERYEELDFVFSFFGTHKDEIVDAVLEDYDEYFAEMAKIMSPRYMGVTDGAGPGSMRMANEFGRKHGMMTLGIGIHVEGQGGYNDQTDAHYGVETEFRTHRQTGIDTLADGYQADVGGNGTAEEIGISVTTMKLLNKPPLPVVMSAPSGLYVPLKKSYDKISGIHQLDRPGKPSLDISGYPLSQPWVSKMVFNTPTLLAGARVFQRFWDDPKKMWSQAGISKQELEASLGKRLVVAERIGRRVSSYLIDSVESYKGPGQH